MNNNDKEFLLSILDDMAVALAQYEVPVPEQVWDKLNRGMTILERSFNEQKKPAADLNFHDWHSDVNLDDEVGD